MSRIAPDIPELQQVPEALRSIAYMRALNRAIREPMTWLLGGAVFALAAVVGANLGSGFGKAGAIVGTVVGTALALLLFFRMILPWRARRVLPSVTDLTQLSALDQVRRADASLKRMADAFEQQETRAGRRKDPRDPSRLP